MAHATPSTPSTPAISSSSPGSSPSLVLSHTVYASATSSVHPIVAHYHSSDGRRRVIARASGDQVCILDGDFELLYTLDFWDAFPGDYRETLGAGLSDEVIQCLRVKVGTEDGQVLILAAVSRHLAIWTASNVSSSSTKRWRTHSTLQLPCPIRSFDFHSGRLVIGCDTSLQLWDLQEGRLWRKSWSVQSPRPVRCCSFNPSGTSFAASCDEDRRVIVWQIRRNPGSRPMKAATLPHYHSVDEMHWRGMPQESSQSDILITRASDGAARIWAPVIDQPNALRLSATIDASSFGKRDLSLASIIDPIFYLDAGTMASILRSNITLLERDIQIAEVGLSSSNQAQDDRDLDLKRTRHKRLQHILSDTPDVFIRFHEDGTIVMRAVASVDRKPPTLLQSYTVLKLANPLLPIAPGEIGKAELIPLSTTPDQSSEAPLGILHLQSRDGTKVLAADFNPSLFFDGQGKGLFKRGVALDAAHGGRVGHLLRTIDEDVLSFDSGGHTTQWSTQGKSRTFSGLERHVLRSQRRVRLPQLQTHHQILAGHERGVVTWDRRSRRLLHHRDGSAESLAVVKLGTEEHPIFAKLDALDGGNSPKVTIVTSKGNVHEGHLDAAKNAERLPSSPTSIEEGEELQLALDMRRHRRTGFPSFATISTLGRLSMWRRSSGKRRWERGGRSIRTHLRNALIGSATSSGLVAVYGEFNNAQTSGAVPQWPSLSIFDLTASEFDTVLQFSHMDDSQDNNPIVSLDWLEVPGSAEILAVTRRHRVEFWTTARRGPNTSRLHGQIPSWEMLSSYDMRQVTKKSITAARWTPQCSLIVSTGHQVHAIGPQVRIAADAGSEIHILEAVHRRTGPLPVYHPTIIAQIMSQRKTDIAIKIVRELAKALDETPMGEIPDLTTVGEAVAAELVGLKERRSGSIGDKKAHESLFEGRPEEREETESSLPPEFVERLCNKLHAMQLPLLTSSDVEELALLVHCLLDELQQKNSVDDNGLRYLTALRLCLELQTARATYPAENIKSVTSAAATANFLVNGSSNLSPSSRSNEARMATRDVVWALQSSTKEAIVSRIKHAYQDKLSWPIAQSTGLFSFLSPASVSPLLPEVAEQVARDQYSLTRDPVSCSLLYYALGKKKLVLGLWRQAAWHPEQKKMLQFLTKDFDEERWKIAACKNAFALMSQRRFEFAASFFMLGDSLQDAVNVCIKNLNDIDLAIALVRIKEGRDDGPVFVNLLKTRVLPLAFDERDRWLAHWAFWLLGDRNMAVRVLCTAMESLRSEVKFIPRGVSEQPQLRPARYEDVSLAVLYCQMNKKGIASSHDFGFALHMAKVLRRLGCHAIAASVLAEWDFSPFARGHEKRRGEDAVEDAPSSAQEMNGRTSKVAALEIDRSQMKMVDNESVEDNRVADAPPYIANPKSESHGDVKLEPASRSEDKGDMVQKEEDADRTKEDKERARKKPGGGVANLLPRAAGNADQQGAAEFDFGNFGF